MSADSESVQRFLHTPSSTPGERVAIAVAAAPTVGVSAVGVPVFRDCEPPKCLGMSRERMKAAGFSAAPGETFVVARADGPVFVATGLGRLDELDTNRVRDTAAAFAEAAAPHADLAFSLRGLERLPADEAAQAAVEGILLDRHELTGLARNPARHPVESLTLISAEPEEARAGIDRGRAYAEVTMLARDIASTSRGHMTMAKLARLAFDLGHAHGLEVAVFDRPSVIKLVYRPLRESTSSIALVGHGLMRGWSGLRPHRSEAHVNRDMSGVAAVLAAIARLRDVGCPSTVTAYLMCADNMTGGSLRALGDVVTTYGGRTVELTNTDADGRLVLCEGLALAAEEGHDAIIDIATLTGSITRALGTDMGALFGNDPALIEQVRRAADATGEFVWPLPLHRPYLRLLASDVASIRNAAPRGEAQPEGLLAAIYLADFVRDVPWAHIDICGTAWQEKHHLWRRAGCSGFGARLLVDVVTHFQRTSRQVNH